MTRIPVSNTQAGRNAKKSAHSRSRRRSRELFEAKQIVFAVIASAAYVATESLTQAEPIPKHTSILTSRVVRCHHHLESVIPAKPRALQQFLNCNEIGFKLESMFLVSIKVQVRNNIHFDNDLRPC
jgi:hypothetical protein